MTAPRKRIRATVKILSADINLRNMSLFSEWDSETQRSSTPHLHLTYNMTFNTHAEFFAFKTTGTY